MRLLLAILRGLRLLLVILNWLGLMLRILHRLRLLLTACDRLMLLTLRDISHSLWQWYYFGLLRRRLTSRWWVGAASFRNDIPTPENFFEPCSFFPLPGSKQLLQNNKLVRLCDEERRWQC
jgi:hypothetical protein